VLPPLLLDEVFESAIPRVANHLENLKVSKFESDQVSREKLVLLVVLLCYLRNLTILV